MAPVRYAVFAASFSLVAGAALAQPYPSKVVRVIVASAPGGGSDTVGRLLAGKLSAQLGHQVVVDNRPGAGGRGSARPNSLAQRKYAPPLIK